MLVALMLLGCGSNPQPLTSKPIEPTADLTAPLPSEPRWTSLEGFFPATPGLPLATPGIDLGMGLEAARTQMDALSLARSVTGTIGGRQIYSITLKSPPTVALAAIADETGTTVTALQFTLPAGECERALLDGWGEPQGISADPEKPTEYFWTDATHTIRWTTFPDRATGMLSYEPKDAD